MRLDMKGDMGAIQIIIHYLFTLLGAPSGGTTDHGRTRFNDQAQASDRRHVLSGL